MPNKRASQSKENGAKSNGPTTPEGLALCKAAVAIDGRKRKAHTSVLPGESLAEFEAFRLENHDMWQPANVQEIQLADELPAINWQIKRKYFVRNADLSGHYDAVVRSLQPGATNEDLILNIERLGASDGSLQPVFDRAISNATLTRNRLINAMLRLKKSGEKRPKRTPPLQTKDLPRTPQDPSSFEPALEDSDPPVPEPAPLADSFEPATAADQVDLSQFPAPVATPTPAVEADILLWAKQNFGFTPDPLQAQIMTDNSGQTLVLGARQTGKSTAAALRVLHTAIQNPGQIILLAGPSSRQSGHILDKARAAAIKLLGKKVKPIAEGFELPNQTQVIGLPDSEPTVRGYSNPLLIVVDEAAFVDDDIYKALLPAQASGRTNIIVMSTPNGQQGFFYEQWENHSAPWTRIKIDAADCPRITEQFLAQARLSLGHESFSQEFHCQFLLAPGAIFTREMVLQCIKPNVEALFPWDEQVMS